MILVTTQTAVPCHNRPSYQDNPFPHDPTGLETNPGRTTPYPQVSLLGWIGSILPLSFLLPSSWPQGCAFRNGHHGGLLIQPRPLPDQVSKSLITELELSATHGQGGWGRDDVRSGDQVTQRWLVYVALGCIVRAAGGGWRWSWYKDFICMWDMICSPVLFLGCIRNVR